MIQGLITKKEVDKATSKKTGSPYTRWVFTIDDKRYSTFDAEIGNEFDTGDYVQIEGKEKEANDGRTYFNMTEMKKVDVKKESKQEFHLSPEECRCRALECAIKWTKEAEMPYLMETANKFLQFIQD